MSGTAGIPAPSGRGGRQSSRSRHPELHHAVVDKTSNRRDPPPCEAQHDHPVLAEHRAVLVLYIEPVCGLPVRPGGDQPVPPRPAPGGAISQEPGDGHRALVLQRRRGIVNHASSVSSATTPSTSPPANAAAKRSATCRSCAERGNGARSRPGPGSECAMVARARCSALFTDASVTESMVATSTDRKPSTSRSTRTARCRGGRRCTRRDERQRDRLLGLIPRLRATRLRSGHRRQAGRPDTAAAISGSPCRVGTDAHGGPGGAGRGWRALARSAFRHRLVAIRYSQVRSDERS